MGENPMSKILYQVVCVLPSKCDMYVCVSECVCVCVYVCVCVGERGRERDYQEQQNQLL